MSKKWISLALWIIGFQAIGLLLGLMTASEINGWYVILAKSSLTPPGFVFSIVWPILYTALAIISWHLFNERHSGHYQSINKLYILQVLMNWAWTPFFFQLHLIGFSFAWLITLSYLNGVIIYKLSKTRSWLNHLLIPYFLWLLFATYLNGMIWILN